MDHPTHIIDPEGEVIIILRNSNSSFAEGEDLLDSRFLHALPNSSGDVQSAVEETKPRGDSEQNYMTALRNKKMNKKRMKKAMKKRPMPLSTTAYPTPEPTQLPTEEPVAAAPVVEESIAEVPAAEEPAAEEPAAEEPAAEEPAAEEPATEEPVVEEPATEEPATEEPATEEPATEEPATEEPATEEPATEEPATEEPATEEPATEEPVTEEQTQEQAETDLENESVFRIQVSAKHLILASSVFKKMFTGGWNEGVTYLQKGSVEITAESWDIEALLILLRAIHGQQYHIPRRLTLEMLAKIAVIVDYYDCKEAVYIWTTIWVGALEEQIPKTYCRDLFLWLWVSSAFQLPAQFKEATSTVMSWSYSSINNLGLPIPTGVIEAMNKQRQEAIDRLIGLLHNTRQELLRGTRGCSFECSSIMYGALTKEMQSVDLLAPIPAAPFPGSSYNILVQQVRSFRVPQWSGAYYSSYQHSCPDSSFESLFGTLNDTIQGLDLHDLLP